MKKTPGGLVRELREAAGWSIGALIGKISELDPNVSFDTATISRFERDKQELSNDRLDALLKVFGMTRATFYAAVEGRAASEGDVDGIIRVPLATDAKLDQDGKICLCVADRSRWQPFLEASLSACGLRIPDLIVVQQTDSAMSPQIEANDHVLALRTHTAPAENQRFVLVSGGGYRVRTLQRDWRGGWTMVPASNEYPREALDDSIKILGLVVWIGGMRT